jgi:hypothetical protein
MSKVRYNKELLDSCMERDGATLVGEYEKLNGECKIKFICSCGKEGNKAFESINIKGGAYCNECTNKNKLEKFKKTNIKKFGTENPFQNSEIKEKIKKNNLEKTGYEYPGQDPKVKEKMKNTYKEKTGYEHPSYNPEIREKMKKTYKSKTGYVNPSQNPEIKEKIKREYKEKTGYEYALQNPEVKKKSKETYKEKTGYENPSQNPEIIKKKRINCIEKTGYENYSQIPEVRYKVKETNLLIYGTEHAIQNPEVLEKSFKSSHRLKDYILPSKNVIKVQGYEPFALDKLIKEWYIKEDDIITDRTKVPEIWWIDSNNKKRRYFIDIFIPLKNLAIEVKSTWTIKTDKDNNQRKLQAVRDLGYNTLLWVFDKKGNVVKEYDNCPIEV